MFQKDDSCSLSHSRHPSQQSPKLRGAAGAGAAILDHAEITVGLAILAAFIMTQEHDRRYRRIAIGGSRG
jgi:hypothetical protein